MVVYDPKLIGNMQTTPAWSALTRASVDFGAASTWDRDLLREPRVLVPIDLQAYVVGAAEPMVRLPSPLSPNAPALSLIHI